MQPLKLFFLWSAGATAFSVPDNLQNGLYHTIQDERGIEITLRVEHDSNGNDVYEQVHPPLQMDRNESVDSVSASISVEPIKMAIRKLSKLAKRYKGTIRIVPGKLALPYDWDQTFDAPPGGTPHLFGIKHEPPGELNQKLWFFGRIFCDCYTEVNATESQTAFDRLSLDLRSIVHQKGLEMASLQSPEYRAWLRGIEIAPGRNHFVVEGDTVVFICNSQNMMSRPMKINAPLFNWIHQALNYNCGEGAGSTYERHNAMHEAVGVRAYVPGLEICRGTKVYDRSTCPGSGREIFPERDLKFDPFTDPDLGILSFRDWGPDQSLAPLGSKPVPLPDK